MGASVGAAARRNQHAVLWTSAERSSATIERASQADLEDVFSVSELVNASEIMLSICPPHAAADVAREVVDLKFTGLYVDCNAVSPGRTRGLQQLVESTGADYVDGSIIGGPAWTPEAETRLYLSGPRAAEVADCFTGSLLATSVISDRIGAASAVKMGFAAYTKGTTALLAAILGMAEREGVRADLARQWGEDFTERTIRRVCLDATKGWRYAGEMYEVAETFRGAGLPEGFHQAAGQVYQRLAGFKDRAELPALESVFDALRRDE